MDNIIVKNKQEVEKYREKIFNAKEDYRKMLAKLPFEEKIEILSRLQKRYYYFKKFKLRK